MSIEVEKLWELQAVLTQLADREKQMTQKPESFAAVDREYQAAEEEMSKLMQSLEQIAKERRRVDGELSDQQELLKKYQGQLMQVKNQQQYAAAWKEIDATRKHVKDLEDSVLKSMSESEALQARLDERKEEHGDLKSRYDAAYAEWQASLGDLRKEADQLRKRAEAIEAGIPQRLRDEFHKIYRQRHGIAVAPVVNDSCSACRTRIRPALFQQLKRGELARCEGCHRILYLEKTAS
ncbi:MAG TPA: C4-type zinc ribbon domain-containing protein [Thermoanaerobaculia bacterium]|nr:C4-type zinc ribbon domain-containing protein [Thermoanaerobaculia bacterium]